ncbi:NADH-ubiquinone oxidoreductase chain 4L [Glycine soja]
MGIRGILLNRRNIPIMSMPIESMLLAVNSNFLVFSVSSDDMMGQSFASLVSTVAAAESAIGLAIFIITFRVRGTIAVEFINSIQVFYYSSMDTFESLVRRLAFSLGNQALSRLLLQRGCSVGLTVAIVVLFFTAEAAPGLGNQIAASSGAENRVSSWHQYLTSNMEGESANEPSTSSSWMGALLSSETEMGGTGTSVNDRVAWPVPLANPVASGEAEAGQSHVVPFPYDENEVIGGDYVLSIQRRLLAKYEFPSAEEIKITKIKAEDLFEVKVDIIRQMTPQDPEEDWLNRGARALDNPRAASGETSLEELYRLKDDLNENGRDSETFERLKDKFF